MNVWNYNAKELLNIAEREDNQVAIQLYTAGYDQAVEEYDQAENDRYENSDFPPVTDSEKFDLINWLYTEAQFEKTSDGVYKLDGFNEDTNLYNNQVRVEKVGGRTYRVVINCQAYGEHEESGTIDGLANAKSEAIKLAVKLIIEGRLNC